MDANSSSSQTTSTGAQSQSASDGSGKSSTLFIAIGIVIILAIVLAIVYFAFVGTSPSTNSTVLPTISQTQSENSTAIYMSASQAETLFGSSLAGYTTWDLFNSDYIINASVFETLVPQLDNNITSGWVTLANSSNTNTYASDYYVVMAVPNASRMSPLVGSATIAPWFMYAMTLVNMNSGSVNGFNYTYEEYSNSTAWAQAVYGWKGNYVALSLEYSNPGYLVNETQLVDITANDTP